MLAVLDIPLIETRKADAWAVMRIGGRVMAVLDVLEEAESLRERLDRAENWPHEIVPLPAPPMDANI